ncbi:LOW QUALITY PROTEIN: regulator of telomere elongation helicase 1-like [Haliotis rubra]|uniref:LOW QUALITY PROTEIN: regulator of telomere elongation helicase 1-like n=1 Tax=Haliotis rubra TaxID=36100 RepID=UPI001EE5583E|nr:LOW QUALITY PROTEIN: regulator of telomere elongation helicase 1-like [Haliotis rubra]
MTQLNVRGVSVDFPFEPYECQKAFMEKVIECLQTEKHGILESPTGTGKTLCLLCSSLAWLQGRKAQVHLNKQIGVSSLFGDKENLQDDLMAKISSKLQQSSGSSWGTNEYVVPKVIYASRTHSQLSQAVQELKRTTYNTVNSCVLGSREQLCIDEKVSKETNNTSKVLMCRAKVQARRCHYYNVLDDMKKNSETRQILGSVVDIEDLVSKGKKNKLCPYYMARELKSDADIIFMPYNYLLDPKSRRAHGVELQGNIIIFDEAHNLERICEESASFDLSSVDIATAMEETTRLMEKVVELSQSESQVSELGEAVAVEPDFDLDDVLKLKETLRQLEERIDEIHIPGGGQGLTKPGMFMFELLAQVNITFETRSYLLDVLEKVVAYLNNDGTETDTKLLYRDLLILVTVVQGPVDTETVVQFMFELLAQVNITFETRSYLLDVLEKVVAYLNNDGTLLILKLLYRDLLLMLYRDLLILPFDVCLENPHVIEKEQVFISVISRGPDNSILNSSYNNRFTASYQTSLGNAVFNFARVVPNGLLVFFPSYPVMEKCVEFWQDNNIWNRVTQYKPVFVEPRGKVAFTDAMDEYYEKINDPTQNGAIFMAVCRGKVSEGLDFADNNGRAVMITGLPFPPRMDPRIVLKMQFLDEIKRKAGSKSLSGQSWYRQQASRAVNQAIGRVIRHKQDFGAILLCDTRFGSGEALAQLPVWVRPYVKKPLNFGHSIRDMMAFFKTAQKSMPAPSIKKKSTHSEAAGCQGAYFVPTFSRGNTRGKIEYEQARTIPLHVPSLRADTGNQTQAFSQLSQQYRSTGKSPQSSTRQSLLQALEHDEKHVEDSSVTFDSKVPASQPVRQNPAKKRKIVIKKQGESSSSTAQPSQPSTAGHLSKAEDYITQVKKVLTAESYKVFSRALVGYRKTEDLTKVTTVLADFFTDKTENYHLFRKFYKYTRPQHKHEFDQLCVSITGQGCGYKPEHSVSSKRLLQNTLPENEKKLRLEATTSSCRSDNLTESANQMAAPHRTKPSFSTATQDPCIPSSVSLNGLNPDTRCQSASASQRVEVVSGGTGRKDDITVSPASDSSSGMSCGREAAGSQSAGQSDCSTVKKTQALTGYTCGLCKNDASIPFQAQCQHVCCYMCWKQVFQRTKECPECGEHVRRRQLTQLLFASGPNLHE